MPVRFEFTLADDQADTFHEMLQAYIEKMTVDKLEWSFKREMCNPQADAYVKWYQAHIDYVNDITDIIMRGSSR